jgi:putative cofactor-binding repeat protein
MKGRIFLAIALAIVLTALLQITLAETPARAQGGCDRWVLGQGGSDSGDCSDETAPCATIQYAIDQSADGDTICVAKSSFVGPLTYPETLRITKSIILDGAWDAGCVDPNNWTCSFTAIPCDPANVTIDALGTGRVISITGNVTPTIHCFTITGGDAAGLGGDPGTTVDNDAGGGIFSRDAAPIIVHNVITGNYGCMTCPVSYGRGGGIYLRNAPSTAVISGNVIAYNVADDGTWGQGGGIMLRDADAQVLSNTIEHNRAGYSAGYGGGIAVRNGEPTLADNDIAFNYAGQGVQGLGGGIFVWTSTPAIIERNELRYNHALHGTGVPTMTSGGGGIYYAGIVTTPVSAIIRDNFLEWNLGTFGGSLSGDGGGIYLRYLSPASIVEGNVLEWNEGANNYRGRGGGIYVADSELTIEGNELTYNTAVWSGNGSHGEGGGIYVDGGAVVIQSNVISANTGSYFPGSPSTATGYGGGVATVGGETTVRENAIANNGGTNGDNWGFGGGIFASGGTLTIEDNTIADNYGSILDVGYGGGAMISGTVALVRGNLITGNQATSDTWGVGGGLFVLSETVRVERNTIAGNRATLDDRPGYGGGLYLNETYPWLDSNVILHNVANNGSGGVGGGVGIGLCPVFTLTNNIIAKNDASDKGSGISIGGDGAGVLIHNTIAQNQGAVGVHVYSGSDVALTNNIVISHWQGIANGDPAGSIVTATHTLFENNGSDYGPDVTSVNEISGPAALLPNYHLGTSSNAIAKALPLAWITHDVDGDARPYWGGPDVGADEVSCRAHIAGGGGVYFSIQEAVNVASSGQTVRVAEGICYENVAITESLTLEGGWDQAFATRSAHPAATTIDGLGRGRAISITEVSGAIAPVIDGFTLTGGDATGLGGSSTPGYDVGGGLYSWYADTTVSDCIIRDNVGSTLNQAIGGGLSFQSGNPHVHNCLIEGNVASTADDGYGGGVHFQSGSATLEDSRIQNNVASTAGYGRGGGVLSFFSDVTLDRNIVRGNVATTDPAYAGYGGGVYLNRTGGPGLTNNVVADNHLGNSGNGSGLFLYDTDLRLLHTTLAHNTGGAGQGVYALAGATVEMTNTILVGHAVGVHAFGTNTTIELKATLWWDTETWALATDGGAVNPQAPNWHATPGFVDAGNGDYHLSFGSPAIDVGITASVPRDIDGDARPIGLAPDLGADEAWLWTFLPVVRRNG